MSNEALAAFLAGACPQCQTPGPWRHLSAVAGCQTCCRDDPRPVHIYPVYPRVQHDSEPLPSRCYQSEYGFTVHIRGACECKGGKPPCPFCGGDRNRGEHWRQRGRMYEGGPYVNGSCGSTG